MFGEAFTGKPTITEALQHWGQTKGTLTVDVAPAYGNLQTTALQELDDELRLSIKVVQDEIEKTPTEERSWDCVASAMARCYVVEPHGTEIFNSKIYTRNDTNYFNKHEQSPDETIVMEVKDRFNNLIGDPDIVESTGIDLKVVNEIVARAGQVASVPPNSWYWRARHIEKMLGIGVLRYPDLQNPYWKVYRIKLAAWSDCAYYTFMWGRSSGITGEFHMRKYKPRKEMLARITGKALLQAEMELQPYVDTFDREVIVDADKSPSQGTSFSTVRLSPRSTRLYYRNWENEVFECAHRNKSAKLSDSLFGAAPSSPLATATLDGGNEIHVYSLDGDNQLQEFCYTTLRGWYPGGLNEKRIQAAPNSSLAAINYRTNSKSSIHLYYQDSESGSIKELRFARNSWSYGTTPPPALRGTGLAAVAYQSQGLQCRLYYQAEDLTIRERCMNKNTWSKDTTDLGEVPACTPIDALLWSDPDVEIQVYWLNDAREIVRRRNVEGQWGDLDKVTGPVKPESKFAATKWDTGRSTCVYWQAEDNSILEVSNDGSGWTAGSELIKGDATTDILEERI